MISRCRCLVPDQNPTPLKVFTNAEEMVLVGILLGCIVAKVTRSTPTQVFRQRHQLVAFRALREDFIHLEALKLSSYFERQISGVDDDFASKPGLLQSADQRQAIYLRHFVVGNQ